MEIYVHVEGEAELRRVTVGDGMTVGGLIAEQAGPGASAWAEEAEEPLDAEATLAEAGVHDRAHIHLSRCRRVSVSVRYGGDTKSRGFSPGATVNAVFAWAAGPQGFGLTPSERAKHTLGVCGAQTEADRDAHVGSLAIDCAVCFDLAPKARYAG